MGWVKRVEFIKPYTKRAANALYYTQNKVDARRIEHKLRKDGGNNRACDVNGREKNHSQLNSPCKGPTRFSASPGLHYRRKEVIEQGGRQKFESPKSLLGPTLQPVLSPQLSKWALTRYTLILAQFAIQSVGTSIYQWGGDRRRWVCTAVFNKGHWSKNTQNTSCFFSTVFSHQVENLDKFGQM